jgi:hypothetical protein
MYPDHHAWAKSKPIPWAHGTSYVVPIVAWGLRACTADSGEHPHEQRNTSRAGQAIATMPGFQGNERATHRASLNATRSCITRGDEL